VGVVDRFCTATTAAAAAAAAATTATATAIFADICSGPTRVLVLGVPMCDLCGSP
jgi:hypothetical protein